MQAIINGFESIISSLKALLEGMVMLAKWIPDALAFTSSQAIASAIPAIFLPTATVIIIIYVIKVVLGGDNGS